MVSESAGFDHKAAPGAWVGLGVEDFASDIWLKPQVAGHLRDRVVPQVVYPAGLSSQGRGSMCHRHLNDIEAQIGRRGLW